jgi:hypothetical protein
LFLDTPGNSMSVETIGAGASVSLAESTLAAVAALCSLPVEETGVAASAGCVDVSAGCVSGEDLAAGVLHLGQISKPFE